YGQPAHPRLVSLVAYGPSVDSVVFTMAFNGNDMFVGGNFDFDASLIQVDISKPRNVINQYLPPTPLISKQSTTNAGVLSQTEKENHWLGRLHLSGTAERRRSR